MEIRRQASQSLFGHGRVCSFASASPFLALCCFPFSSCSSCAGAPANVMRPGGTETAGGSNNGTDTTAKNMDSSLLRGHATKNYMCTQDCFI